MATSAILDVQTAVEHVCEQHAKWSTLGGRDEDNVAKSVGRKDVCGTEREISSSVKPWEGNPKV